MPCTNFNMGFVLVRVKTQLIQLVEDLGRQLTLGKQTYLVLLHFSKAFDKEILIVLAFNDTSTLVDHFVLSPREREKRDRRDSRRDEREGQGRKSNRNESEETEETKTLPLYHYLLQG